jgi:hypothetical protein
MNRTEDCLFIANDDADAPEDRPSPLSMNHLGGRVRLKPHPLKRRAQQRGSGLLMRAAKGLSCSWSSVSYSRRRNAANTRLDYPARPCSAKTFQVACS